MLGYPNERTFPCFSTFFFSKGAMFFYIFFKGRQLFLFGTGFLQAKGMDLQLNVLFSIQTQKLPCQK